MDDVRLDNAFADTVFRVLLQEDGEDAIRAVFVDDMAAPHSDGASRKARELCKKIAGGHLDPQAFLQEVSRDAGLPDPCSGIEAMYFLQMAADPASAEKYVTLHTMRRRLCTGILGSLMADVGSAQVPAAVLESLGHWSEADETSVFFDFEKREGDRGDILLCPPDPVAFALTLAKQLPPESGATDMARYADRLVPGILFTTVTDDASTFTHRSIHEYRTRMDSNGLERKQVVSAITRLLDATTEMMREFDDPAVTGLLEYVRVRCVEGAILLGFPALAQLEFSFVTEVSALFAGLKAHAVRLNRLALGDMEHEFWPASFVGPIAWLQFPDEGERVRLALSWTLDVKTRRLL